MHFDSEFIMIEKIIRIFLLRKSVYLLDLYRFSK